MNCTNILGMEFISHDDAPDHYQIYKGNDQVGRCYCDKGLFHLEDQHGTHLHHQECGNDHKLSDKKRLFALIHAAQALKLYLSGSSGVDWKAPLRFRDADSLDPAIVDVHFNHGEHIAYVMVEYPHPITQKPVTDVWTYEPTNGRPLNPLLRMNPLRRYDIINDSVG